MKAIAALLAICLLACGPVWAGEKLALPPAKDKDAKAKQTRHNWTGFYVGTDLGYSQGSSKWSTQGASGGFSNGSATGSPSFGGHAGYNYQFGQGLTLGGEGDLSR